MFRKPRHGGTDVDTQREPSDMAETGLLIDMRNIVKTYNVGEPSELTVLHTKLEAKESEASHAATELEKAEQTAST